MTDYGSILLVSRYIMLTDGASTINNSTDGGQSLGVAPEDLVSAQVCSHSSSDKCVRRVDEEAGEQQQEVAEGHAR